MKDSRLIKILKTLSAAEFSDFEKFIAIPYFSKGRNLLPYLKALKKYYPDFDSEKLSKENIYTSLHKGSSFDKKANELMNTLNSNLQKVLDKFLILKKLDEKNSQRNILLSEALMERGLHQSGMNILKKTKEEIISKGIEGEYFINLQRLISLEAEGYTSTGNTKKFHDSYIEYADSILMSTLIFFFNDLPHRKNFNIGSNVNLNLSVLSKGFSGMDFASIINSLSKQNKSNSEILDVYYHLYLCYCDIQNLDTYKKFRDKVFNNLDKFVHSEKFNLLNYLSTICEILNRFTDQNMLKYLYEVYLKMLETGAYSFRKNEIHHTTFNNIVSNFLSVQKYNEAEKFINEYEAKIPSELRSRYKNMGLARLFFETGEFRKSLDILLSLPDLALNRISVYQLKILNLYELGEYESAINQTESLKKYLKENKTISNEQRNYYYGFASGMKILIDSRIDPSVDTDEKLTMLFKKYPATFRKNWLLKKAKELK